MFFFVKNIRVQSHLIFKFCLYFGILLKYCSSFRTNIWLHLSSIKPILLHIIIGWVFYKYTDDILFLGYSWQFCVKIQNFVGGNNQFEKRYRQKLEKCFINIKILPGFAKLSVAVILYQKSTKLHLICYILAS